MRSKSKPKTNRVLEFLYSNFIGRILLYPLVNSALISTLLGKFMDTKASKVLISGFIKKYNINISDYEDTNYDNFNQFFIRKIKKNRRPVGEYGLISPCDSKLTYYRINKELEFKVKNTTYTLDTLINDKDLAEEYYNGDLLIFRLSPEDYHRYYYFDDGETIDSYKIKGKYHTVNPIVYDKYKVFKENERVVNVLKTVNYKEVLYIEVGALLVGKIVNTNPKSKYTKGLEKGYFKYGGSTIILVFKNGVIKVDKDIISNSKNGYETIVNYGEKIGIKEV